MWWNLFLGNQTKVYQELLEIIQTMQEQLVGIQDTIDAEEEPDLYVSPSTAQEQYETQIREWKEWRECEPGLWQLFREEIDIETLAFYLLPQETKDNLMN